MSVLCSGCPALGRFLVSSCFDDSLLHFSDDRRGVCSIAIATPDPPLPHSHLAGQISDEYTDRITSDPPKAVDDIMKLVEVIIPYNMQHNAESEACDLAMETERIDLLEANVDAKAYARVSLDMGHAAPHSPCHHHP